MGGRGGRRRSDVEVTAVITPSIEWIVCSVYCKVSVLVGSVS